MTVCNFRRIGSRIVGFVNGQMLNKDLGDLSRAQEAEGLLRDYKEALKYGDDPEVIWEEIEPYFYPYKRILKGDKLEVENGKVFLKGSKIPMPPDLATTIMSAADEGDEALDAYIAFWKNCCLNPNTTARDSFFRYVQNSGIVITDHGYALLYKAVTHKEKHHESVDLARYVAQDFVSAAMRGDNPSDLYVIQGGDGFRTSLTNVLLHEGEEVIGRLSGLMRDLQMRVNKFAEIGKTETLYTDKHTQKMDIRLGVQQTKDRNKCDPDISRECSYGLHVGSYQYVRNFGYADDTILLAIVNPKDVVAVPQYDSSKIRVCAYLPVGIMEQDEEGNWSAIKQTYFEMDYLDYEADELDKQFAQIEHLMTAESATDATLELLQEQKQIISQRLVEIKPHVTDRELVRQSAPEDLQPVHDGLDCFDPPLYDEEYEDYDPDYDDEDEDY